MPYKPEMTAASPPDGQATGTPAAEVPGASPTGQAGAGAEESTPAISVLGVQTIKQFMSAASLLQSMQQRMLRADFAPASIAHDASVSKVCRRSAMRAPACLSPTGSIGFQFSHLEGLLLDLCKVREVHSMLA